MGDEDSLNKPSENVSQMSTASATSVTSTEGEKDVEMLKDVTKTFASLRRKSRVGNMSTMTQVENFRERMAKAKEDRTARVMGLQLWHRHICDMVGIFLHIDSNEVVDGVADDPNFVKSLDNFLIENGTQSVIFFYQDEEAPSIDTGRYSPQLPKDTLMKRVTVGNASSNTFKDRAVVAYRILKEKAIDMRNINDEVFFCTLNVKDHNGNVVSMVYDVIDKIIKPNLLMAKDWGDLPKTEAGLQIKKDFLGDFEHYCNFLDTTRIDLDGIVKFTYNYDFYKSTFSSSVMIKSAVEKIEVVHQVEATVRSWAKIMERVLTQFQQLRREDEFVGPLVEIEYWRRQLARFTSIVDFIKSDVCMMHLMLLNQAKSKFLKFWQIQDNAVTDARNECQDNVKYLYALERYWEPLYRCDPSQIPDHLPALLYSIRMVFTTSRYYNNTASVTAILVKVSNQMISSCRKFLNCDGAKTVWNQPRNEVMDKFKVCLDLYLKYYQCFKHILAKMEEMGEPPFDCSEMYVFGKFETFKKRIEKIIDVFETTTKYSVLQSSTIEGINDFATKFIKFYMTISVKKYDALNHRLATFNTDYTEFKQNVVDTEYELEEYVGTCLENMTDVDNILRLLKRFEKLNLDCLHLDERYLEALEIYQTEIEELRDKYNEDRQTPPIPKNMPPISGRIIWIRQFYKRIEEPMDVFKEKRRVMRHRKAQKCIQLYNALATVFVHYEQIYHNSWFENLHQVRGGLSAPILMKHPKTKRFIVNFDPYIIEAIRESEYMYKLELEVPDSGQIIVFCRDKILKSYEMMTALIKRHDFIRLTIPKLFFPLLKLILIKMENIFMPGFSSITWTSMKIPQFCKEVGEFLDYIEVFVKEASDIKEARIDEVVDGIAQLILVHLPADPVPPDEFLRLNQAHRAEIVKEIELKSSTAEKAVVDLINKFMASITEPDLQKGKFDWLDPDRVLRPVGSSSKLVMSDEDAAFKEIDRNQNFDIGLIHNDCIEMFAYFNMSMTDALVKCTKTSLDQIKKRAASTSLEDMLANNPIMKTNMELHIPTNMINPELDEIQNFFTLVLNNIIDTHTEIIQWGQRYAHKKKTFNIVEGDKNHTSSGYSNYYQTVSEHKEIVRLFMGLQGAMYLLKPDVLKLLESYLAYAYLWAEDREDQINEFCEMKPLVVEIAEKFKSYDERGNKINALPEFHNIGAVQVCMENYKLGLLVESNAWKHNLGKNLAIRYKEKLMEMVDFIKAQEKILAKPIKDLDDCRLAMSCLERIRENFIDMDMDLVTMEEAYATFIRFKIDISKEEVERVDTLRFNFTNMLNNAKNVQEQINNVQGPLQDELTEGVKDFVQEVIDFDIDYEANGPMIPGLSAREASDKVLLFQAQFEELWRKFEMYSSGERLFGLEVHDYPILHQKKKEFNLLNKLYGLYLTVNNSIDGYFDILWADVDTEVIMTELQDFQNRCRKLPKGMKDWPAFLELKKKIDDFNETCPLLEMMANKAMKDRHWKRIATVTKYNFDIDSPTFTLRNVMEAPLLNFKDDVEDICISAVKEKDIEAKLKQVIADWAIVDLSFANFKTRGELLLKGAEAGDIIALLEDSLMIMNSLLSNRYNAPFKKDIQIWVSKLVNTSEILEKWLIVQNLWIYLEAVFVGGDIARQLPAEAKRFSGIDKSWVKIMTRAREIQNAVECCTFDDTMMQILPYLLEQLETCQKSLSGYLESKRLCFPRFFFISDPVLLEILGQSSDPQSIQPHLLSLFDAVAKVKFDKKKSDMILGMSSNLDERVSFEKPVVCTGGVEIWLNSLLSTVKDTVKNVIAMQSQCFKDPEYDFIKGFVLTCGQAGLVGVQVLWTKESEFAIKRAKVDKVIMKNTNKRFLDLLNSLIDLTSKDLTVLERTRFETMVTIHVHQRDIFDDIVKLKVRSLLDFEWQKQARFYYNEENDDVLVRITDVIFLYQNEYLGVTERLAITPLTDRCYITLAQAIWMNMGGAPAGPAGTGKTETVKDMGRTLGKLVVVFNCSDQMDFRGLGRIFKGLAQSGTWGCFDEFNRIELPVLSVAAQQIYIVLQARKERKPMFIFTDGDNVAMNIEFGIFLTMNPGYAGRQELPENLKIMFRSVAMMVPDRQIIIRVKLASCGFKENVVLCRKFFTLYKLCEEQLSKQVHYDFGLRNILSVLRTLGAQRRTHPTDTEETIVMRVLRDMNLSKLVDEDEPLFLSLIEDMFPGIKLSAHSWKDLQKAINNQCEEMGLINYPSWNLKILQLYETSLVRHGLMVMGPTGAGKTQCMHCLMRSQTENGLPHKEMRMNPKAITAPQMFGRLDVSTNDWTDGIFSTLWRRTWKVKKSDFVWLVLDGPVDAVWIENLNSVLDDNKTLTLANGDRIVMAPNCKLVFEPDNVDNASPATVSRMGMVFMSASVLPWMPILDSWLKTRSFQETEIFRHLFHKIYNDIQNFLIMRLKPKIMIREALYIRQCYDVLEGILDTENDIKTDRHLEHLFLFSVMWSLGAALELDDRVKWEEFVLTHPSRMNWPKVQERETIFEYVVSVEGKWEHWSERVEQFLYPSDHVLEYASILVPNVDNVRTAFLIETIAKQNKAVLLIGEQGTAKTVMIKGFTAGFDPEFKLCKMFNFSSATTPNMVQRIIESYVDKRVGTTYGPPTGKTLTIFIDDINMPVINAWGDQVTNEIVRQLMEGGGFYSLDKPGDFSAIMDVLFLAAMIHPGGGRNDIPHRLKRHFCIFNCTLPSKNSMDQIFNNIGEGYFCIERFNETIVEFLPRLIPLTRNVWQQTKTKMLPTPAKFHYVFNLRDLSRIWQGILTIEGEDCKNLVSLLKLWQHECTRVIADRFTNEQDREWFLMNMKRQASIELEDIFDKHYNDDECYFVDFLKEPPEATGDEPEDFSFEPPKIYEEVPSFDFLKEKLFFYEGQYNETVRGGQMDMVFFHDAMVHLMIISRIVRTPRGNALLVGVGGSGKQSLTRLASFIAGYKNYQIQLTRSYNVNNLMDDMKYLYRVAGFEGQGIAFIFTDNEIKDENFLESINNVLSSGEIANLFAKDELDEIQTDLIPVMKKVHPKRPPSNDNLYDFFINRARNNLHVVLCFSPVGEKFRTRAMKFPGLISGCTMDWFSKWPMDALIEVSQHFLKDFEIICTSETKQELIYMTAEIQDGVAETCTNYYDRFRRQTYVTPKTFLSFLSNYKVLYEEKLEAINVLAMRMKTGLTKLIEAASSVNILKQELVVKNKEIAKAGAEASVVLVAVQESQKIAKKLSDDAEIFTAKAKVIVDAIAVDKQDASNRLKAAEPALEAAEQALKTIKAADIATVRKLGKPPFLIMVIMDAVLLYFKRRLEPTQYDAEKKFLVTSWSESLKVMADTKFLSKLQDYPKDTINSEMLDLLVPYFDFPQYTYEAAKTACGNVAGLISWTVAMASFYEVNKEVLPLKANLARQQVKLDKAQSELDYALKTLEETVAEGLAIKMRYDKALSFKKEVEDDYSKCRAKMDAATALIEGLSGEKVRWTEQSAQFKAETERLVGDVIVLTAFLNYTGPFNQEFRVNMQTEWADRLLEKKIPLSSNISVTDSLTDTATVGEWNLQGLPTDELSIQNGIIVTKASRYPLLIDPQSQGKAWIRNKEKDNSLIVTALSHKYFRNHIEDAISLGMPMLIEDVGEELDPVLDNVLEKNHIKIGTTYKVKVGDKEVDYMKDFRMYITTKLANPSYTPEIFARTSVIDFTVTMKGLEDQLLGRVILSEKRELESERTNLIKDVTANKRKILELEQNLLYKLTTTQGSLVDDESVIGVLNVTKSTATEVREKIDIARDTEIKINAAREEFRPIATRGSVLYFLITSMAMVNCMYQTSLVQFLERFDLSMLKSEKSPIQSKRINFIIDYLTYEIFKYKSRGLYEVDKYMFVLMMCLRIDLQRNHITHEEFQNFIKGGAALDLNSCPPKPSKWITDLAWLNLVELSNLRHFQYIVTQITNNEKVWKVWFDKDAPEEASIPDGYNALDTFRRLLLIRSMCPDRTLTQSRKYIGASMGQRFAEPVILNMETMLSESRPLTPMICFLSTGSDPTPYIEQLAKRVENKVKSMSMGQGQEVHARKLLLNAMTDGFWALLQNCHLGLDYMEEVLLQLLELERNQGEGMHANFRLWITTEVHPSFPIGLLQLCIKFTNEPPSGIRAGVLRTYTSMNQDMLDYSDQPQYIPLVYAISYLHTIVQERRKFGPLGWNIPYEFNSADHLASCMFVQNHLEDLDPKRGLSWSTIRYMLGEVQYGGRVTDDYDKRLLNTFAKVWFSEKMFADDFNFYKGYKILKFKQVTEYMEAIALFATIDPPQAYGLHPNADITYQTNSTSTMLYTILSIQPKESGGGGGETREGNVARQAQEMLSKMPLDYDPFETKERLKAMGLLNSLNIFLRQEIDRMVIVIKLVRTTLRDLLLAIEGTIIMNEALRDALDNIYDALVPTIWRKGSWASSSLGFWYTEFIERDLQFKTWCFSGRPPSFWMTGFFNPQGFLTAMRQEVARAHKGWALDQVTLHNEVTKSIREEIKVPPPEGVFVYGLFLDGAGWDRRHSRLTESINKVLYTLIPVVHIYAIFSTAPKDPKLYTCPVYKKSNRTDLNYITPLWLCSAKPPEHWILRGVALLCDIM
ncbi:PREDICTED: dynein heavy chain 8, axonemal [Nicrophorus vespilloides]|uniref:Dynein heavy chain 8, axonemal n=1 Tax=Nicrophorus vespilloides TaxID=110193 RepID=A0ABM1MKQ1_NICVS|nr:PREDICTED: dynein heavy chain 8, axonemal [Nicrophorus vespilloides]